MGWARGSPASASAKTSGAVPENSTHSAANRAARAGPEANCSSGGPDNKLSTATRHQTVTAGECTRQTSSACKRRFVQNQARTNSCSHGDIQKAAQIAARSKVRLSSRGCADVCIEKYRQLCFMLNSGKNGSSHPANRCVAKDLSVGAYQFTKADADGCRANAQPFCVSLKRPCQLEHFRQHGLAAALRPRGPQSARDDTTIIERDQTGGTLGPADIDPDCTAHLRVIAHVKFMPLSRYPGQANGCTRHCNRNSRRRSGCLRSARCARTPQTPFAGLGSSPAHLGIPGAA